MVDERAEKGRVVRTRRWKREWVTKRASERVKEAKEAEFCVYACRCRRCRRCRPCPALPPSPIRSSVVLRQGTLALSTANEALRIHRDYTENTPPLPTCQLVRPRASSPSRASSLSLCSTQHELRAEHIATHSLLCPYSLAYSIFTSSSCLPSPFIFPSYAQSPTDHPGGHEGIPVSARKPVSLAS